jgi:TolB-like protein
VLLASNLLTYSQLLEEVARMNRYYYGSPHSFFFKTWDVRKQLIDTSRRLAYKGFRDEISVLDNYLHILGEQMGLKKSTVNLLIFDDELIPRVANRPLDLHLENLFHEMYLSLQTKPPGNIAVADFDMLSGRDVDMPVYLGEAAGVWLSRLLEAGFKIVERRSLDAVLKEQELALSDLGDQENAAKVGMFLAANYVLTGAVMEMEESVVIFSRLINVETAVIETAAQVIVPKEDIAPQLL